MDAVGFFLMSAPFFIVGLTAVGKSSLAVKLAKRCGAEIIGADAFQVYGGFDLLTAKPSPSEQASVPHHLIGTIPPTESYNVACHLEDAQRCLEAVSSRGKPALVVGGTGLYVKALTHGLSPLPEADPAIRAELESLESPALLTRLRALDPVAADTIDIRNKRRLVRALEVCLMTGQPFSSYQYLWDRELPNPQPNGVFFVRSKDEMHTRIERRVAGMFAQGVVEEVRAAEQTTLSPTASRMIGLQDVQDFLADRQTLEQAQENIRSATRRYAKRQVTWFQRERNFERFDLSVWPDEQTQLDWLCERFTAHLDHA